MDQATEEDWRIIEAHDETSTLADRVLEHLRKLEGEYGGFAVTRFEHSLQTASRAHRDGRDEEYVVCALLHDIGDTLAPDNHAEIAAAILRPYVSERNRWMVAKHALFQGYYYFQHFGMDPNLRDRYRDHPHFDHTAEFCEKYDQVSFDPAYQTLPLDTFVPMLHRVLAKPRGDVVD